MDIKPISRTSLTTITTKGNTARFIPVNKYYDPGDEGDDGCYITEGSARQNNSPHLCSDVCEGARDDELAKSAVGRKRDRFDAEVNVCLRDIRYEEKKDVIGWTYAKKWNSLS